MPPFCSSWAGMQLGLYLCGGWKNGVMSLFLNGIYRVSSITWLLILLLALLSCYLQDSRCPQVPGARFALHPALQNPAVTPASLLSHPPTPPLLNHLSHRHQDCHPPLPVKYHLPQTLLLSATEPWGRRRLGFIYFFTRRRRPVPGA